MRANFGLCVHMHSPTDVHTLMGACTHEYRPPPTEAEREVKAWVCALYLEVNGAGFSPSTFMWLLGLKLRLPGLCGKRLLPTEPPCRPFFFLERVSLGGSGQPLTQGTPALALQS